jgi:N,N'-diacetyllegionaminate synthase
MNPKTKAPFIVAEAAQGYEGDITLARLLIKAAASAGADAIKFQLVYADEIATPNYKYYKLFQNLEMSRKDWYTVSSDAQSLGIELYFDVFGDRSFRLARSLGAHGLKIHATDFYNNKLLRQVLGSGIKVLLSCAGLGEDELLELFERHPSVRQERVTFMHGFQAEPTPLSSNHLRRLGSLADLCSPAGIGFMDHSDGGKDEAQELAFLSLPLGASLIEKHITLDRELKLEDYVSALPPREFRHFVKKIRKYSKALGSPLVRPSEVESRYRMKSAKVVVAARNLKKGAVVASKYIKLLRVAKQESLPTILDPREVVGAKLKMALAQNRPILPRMIIKN